MTKLLIDSPINPEKTFIFSHGAGAQMDSPFMDYFAKQLCERGLKVVRFEFEYMEKRRQTGTRRPPDRLPKLIDKYMEVAKLFEGESIILGGKSMGGRIASILCAQNPSLFKGCICLGYPFHPPTKPEKLRTDHLIELKTKTLICQGERDTFGNKNEIEAYNLSKKIDIFYLKDGDHGFKPRKKSGLTEEQNWLLSIEKVSEWIKRLK